MFQKSIYNLKINTAYMYDMAIERVFRLLCNGIRHVMPSTDRRLEKTSMAQTVSQPVVYPEGAVCHMKLRSTYNLKMIQSIRIIYHLIDRFFSFQTV